MGSIGGSEWDSGGLLAMDRVMNQLQSPTVVPDDGGLNANLLFNTGLATQLSPTTAMAIWAIRWNFAMAGPTVNQNVENDIIGILTEDIGATIAGDELTDPRTLAEAGTQFWENVSTNVGANQDQQSLLWTAKFSPPLWTIAQRLNIVGSIIEQGAGTAPDYQIHMKIYYTIEPITQEMQNQLIQRLNLAVQP